MEDSPRSKANCVVCDREVDDYEPAYCCSGYECGCMGLPAEPPVCSAECWDTLMKQADEPAVLDTPEKLAEGLKVASAGSHYVSLEFILYRHLKK